MKKRTLWKDIKKSFKNSAGRFFSIMLLMALGSFALVGLFVTGPDMRATGQTYFEKLNVADISIIGDYGIREDDQKVIEKAKGIDDVEYIYLKDVVVKNSDVSFRLFSKPKDISKYEVEQGRMPTKQNEIAIDVNYQDQYPINSVISFSEKSDALGSKVLKKTKFKVVGYIQSGEILSKENKGQTTAGTGSLDSFGVVSKDVFDSDVYMMAKITFKDTKGLDPYSDEYTDLIQKHKDNLNKLLVDQPQLTLATIKDEANETIQENQDKLDDAKNELDDARNQLADAAIQIADAKDLISSNEQKLNDAASQIDNAQSQINQNEALLQSKQKEYQSGLNEYNVQSAKLTDGQNQLNNAQAQINQNEALLQSKQQEYQTNLKAYNEKNAQVAEVENQITQAQSEINQKKTAYESGKAQYESGLNELQSNIQALQTALTQPLPEDQKAELTQKLAALQTQYDAINQEYQALLQQGTQLESVQEQLDAKKQELAVAKQQLASAKVALDDGQSQLESNSVQLANAKSTLSTKNQELLAYKNQLASASGTLTSAKSQLDSGWAQLNSAKVQLQSAKAQYESGKTQLANAKEELASKEQEYLDKKNEFDEKEPDALKEIDENQEKIDDARESLDKLTAPVYNVDTRREIPGGEGYKIYETVSEIVDSLAKIFPVFLYFVAALVTLTTMARFVDEERINAGTLRALGYEDNDIIKKFCVYGLVAGMLGTVLGIVLGHTLLPFIVYNAYHNGFIVPTIEMHFYPIVSLVAIILAFASAVVPAYVVAKKELQEQPASLLLPKPPAAGSKIFMEHITFIWKRLSFTHKVTCRNIFRYKQRMFMTIFGVAGAVALIFTGFGVQHSISGIKASQFGSILKYDMIVAQNETATKKDKDQLITLLDDSKIKSSTPVHYESVSKESGAKNDRQSMTMIVSKNDKDFNKYISVNERKSQKAIDFSNDGVIISERLSKLLDVKVGDYFTFNDSNDVERTAKVSGICEMYTGHFIFMNEQAYEKIYQEDYTSNAYLMKLKDSSIDNTKVQATRFMELDAVKGVVQNTTMTTLVDTIVTSLNKIMIVLILVAILLGTVILYNLTNINVSERIRELSTIKVLGFYDPEVTMYIYRETIILSAIGIVVGWFIGMALHSYILAVVPPDEVMFNPVKWIGAFIIPFIVITGISYVLKYVVNHKLKNVDMLEALKSVD